MIDTYELGKNYEKSTESEIRKQIGQYYTPDFIVEYIINSTLLNFDIIENPFVSVIDISCGAGFFLLGAYHVLKKMFIYNIEKLQQKYKDEIYDLEINGIKKVLYGSDYWKKENIHYHLLRHCIYGADKDPQAVNLTKMILKLKDAENEINHINIVECDSLVKWEEDYDWQDLKKQLEEDNTKKEYVLRKYSIDDNWEEINIGIEKAIRLIRLGEFWSKKYDICLGNPPYIGHKQLDMQYKDWLLNKYRYVFKDKSDLSFCFFQRILNIIKPQGISGIITSRYFLESPTGQQLRSYLRDNASIKEIVDFYGAKIFKDADVATAIFIFYKKQTDTKNIEVHKLLDDNHNFEEIDNLMKTINSDVFENFTIDYKYLAEDRWVLISQDCMNIYEKIQNKVKYNLKIIATSFQGIITGCDKAFVLSTNDVVENNIEKDLLRPWIKNSNVCRYILCRGDLNIIYSDLILDEKSYPNSIEFISRYKNRLNNRRECKRGIRKWFQLQWGRDIELFQQRKIVFPYKATSNRFALDNDNYFSSADVYSLIIKDEFKDLISLEYLVGLLNSSIYEFYFKLFAKKMGRGIYDYYPNSIMDLKIITDEEVIKNIETLVTEIIEILRDSKDNFNDKLKKLELEIDYIIKEYLGIDDEEYNLIRNRIQ